MFQRICIFVLATMSMLTVPLWAQQPCPNMSVAIDTPEDQLMLAVNGADNPKEQIDALDKFSQAHSDSRFMPCVNEYYAMVDLKLQNYDKSIEYGEKDLAANYQDLNLLLTLLRAYAASTKVSDTAFDVINKVPDQAKQETGNIARPAKATDDDWDKMQKEAAGVAKDAHDYAVWAFFQIIPRVTDATKQVQVLDTFLKTYPEVAKDNAAQVDSIYFQAYRTQGNLDKTVEYGDKVIAEDPNNVLAMNTMALIYAFYSPHPSLDKAAEYAQKALTTAQGLKKPDGVDEAAFKAQQDTQIGMANLVLGYSTLMKPQKPVKLGPAIEQLKLAGDLLGSNPALQGQALYYLAFCYEKQYPANHQAAMAALNKSVTLPGPFQSQSEALLAKIHSVAK
jgi:tetratricopeptide (TPR) repeat protein